MLWSAAPYWNLLMILHGPFVRPGSRRSSMPPGAKGQAETPAARTGMTLRGRWKLGKVLGEGACGQVFETVDVTGAQPEHGWVIKVSPLPPAAGAGKKRNKRDDAVKRNADTLYMEQLVYKNYLQGVPNIPALPASAAYGEDHGFRFLVMQRLGLNLYEEFEARGKVYLPALLADHGRQMLNTLQRCHERQLLFVDVKPENFMLGLKGTPEEGTVFMVDFGLVEKFIAPNGSHRADLGGGKGGTPLFLSLSCHEGKPAGRKDDVEALGMVLLFFARGGELPWSAATSDADCLARKRAASLADLCKGLPGGDALRAYIELARATPYDAQPDYARFDGLLEQMGRAAVPASSRKQGAAEGGRAGRSAGGGGGGGEGATARRGRGRPKRGHDLDVEDESADMDVKPSAAAAASDASEHQVDDVDDEGPSKRTRRATRATATKRAPTGPSRRRGPAHAMEVEDDDDDDEVVGDVAHAKPSALRAQSVKGHGDGQSEEDGGDSGGILGMAVRAGRSILQVLGGGSEGGNGGDNEAEDAGDQDEDAEGGEGEDDDSDIVDLTAQPASAAVVKQAEEHVMMVEDDHEDHEGCTGLSQRRRRQPPRGSKKQAAHSQGVVDEQQAGQAMDTDVANVLELEVVEGVHQGESFLVISQETPAYIGRSKQLASAGGVPLVRDRELQMKHCKVEVEGDRLQLTAYGSADVSVNGLKVGKTARAAFVGDKIQLGSSVLVVAKP